jgi:branched-chain amino acid transport system permease protein
MQIVVNGFVSGIIIALVAVAFQAVYLPTRIFFIGLAGIYAGAPYFAHACIGAGLPWPFALAVSVALSVGLSMALEWGTHSPLAKRRAGDTAQLIASLGMYIVIVQLIVLVWGNSTRTLLGGNDTTMKFGNFVVTQSQWTAVAVGGILLSGLAIFLSRTTLGLRFRAMADNPTQFALYGHNVDNHRYVGFALAGGFASVASLLTASDIGFEPYAGLRQVILAIVAVVVGGRGTFIGPLLGALILGLARAQVVWLFGARWQDAAMFGLLAVFLLIRPQGLIAKRRRLEDTL